MAAALSAAHRQGVVHRDVKPGNVLLDEEGNAYLTDFGVALDAGAPERSSGTMIRGTPAYLSPEQVRLAPALAQSDVYALGIVAYEMLTGLPPFPVTSLQGLLDHHLRDPVPSVREVRPELPAAIDRAIAHATAKDAKDRYFEAVELAAALRVIDVATGEEILPIFREVDESDWSTEGGSLAIASGGRVEIVDRTGASIGLLQIPGSWIEDVRFGPDGNLLATAVYGVDGVGARVDLWDRGAGRSSRRSQTPPAWGRSMPSERGSSRRRVTTRASGMSGRAI